MNERQHYRVNPMPIAAEIHDLDLSKLSYPSLQKDLYADWMTYGVLVFRDTKVDNRQHLALSRCFGELEQHPLPEMRTPEDPLLMKLGSDKPDKAFVYDGDKLLVGRVAWHRDTAYTVDVAKGAMLRIVELPEGGGETSFSDTAAAYDALPADLKTQIDKLEFKATLRLDSRLMTRGITWSSIRAATREESQYSDFAVALDALARFPSVVHPLAITHPESGRKCIYISPTYLDEILGIPKTKGDELLDFLVAHTTSPAFVYEHRWRPNDLVLWDNRRMIHAAAGYPPKYRRVALRTTLAGALKSGRLYNASATAAQPDLLD